MSRAGRVELSTSLTDAELASYEAVKKTYADTLNVLEALPPSRMRALAISDLESSFSRAIFAASNFSSPIRGT